MTESESGVLPLHYTSILFKAKVTSGNRLLLNNINNIKLKMSIEKIELIKKFINHYKFQGMNV